MDQWSGKVAIVTGASGGIGSAIAEALVENGLKVVGAARRLEKLQELAVKLKSSKGTFYPIECDLEKEEDILKMFKWTEKQLGGVDILVNNAAILQHGKITEMPAQEFRQIMNTNVVAVAICIREAVQIMKKNKNPGHIININSVAGHFAETLRINIGLYPASKYALNALTLAVRHELEAEQLNVKITSISPGAVDTAMISSFLNTEMRNALPTLSGKDVANAAIFALSASPGAQVFELMITPHDPVKNAMLAKFVASEVK